LLSLCCSQWDSYTWTSMYWMESMHLWQIAHWVVLLCINSSHSFHMYHTDLSARPVVLKLSWAVAPIKRLSTLMAPCSSKKYLVLASAHGSQGETRAPFEKPWPRPLHWIWFSVDIVFLVLRTVCGVSKLSNRVSKAWIYVVAAAKVWNFAHFLLSTPITTSTKQFWQ